MATGSFVSTKTYRDGTQWNLYTIDRARGGKAPTSGRMGKNADDNGAGVGESGDRTRSRGSLSQYQYDTETQQASQVASDGDLSQYAKITYVDGQLGILQRAIEAERRVTIEISKADTGELRVLEGHAHEVAPDVLACLAANVHVYLVGPAGSGKTHMASTCAEALGRELYICGAMLTKHEVTGFMNANGGYVTTAARQAYEFGGILLWDEADASMPAALVAVNAMLANGEYTFPDKTVKRHADFVVIAAGNTFGRGADREYVGRLQLDAATLDRFAFIEMGYDHGLERALARAEYKAHGGTDVQACEQWLDKVIQVRDACAEGNVRHVVSPRASINGCRLIARGMPQRRVVELVLNKGIDNDTARQIGVA
jgi:hypothetical protein